MNTTRKERFIQKATRLTVKVLLFSLLLSLFLYAGVGTDSALVPGDISAENGIARAAGSALSTIKDTTPANSVKFASWHSMGDEWGDASASKTYANLNKSSGSTTSSSTATVKINKDRSLNWFTYEYNESSATYSYGVSGSSIALGEARGGILLATEFAIPYSVSSSSKLMIAIDYSLQRTSGSGDYVGGLFYACDTTRADNRTYKYDQKEGTGVNNNDAKMGNDWATNFVTVASGSTSGRFIYSFDVSGSGTYYLTVLFAKPYTGNGQAYTFSNTISSYTLSNATTQYALTNRADFDVLSLTTNAGYNYSGKTLYVEPTNGSSIAMGGDFTPVGTSAHPFSGTIEGNGKLISGYNTPAVQYSGLFGYISGATLRNFTVNPGTINGNATDKGAVVGYMTGSTLSGITTSGGAVWGYGYTGGIVGRAEGTSSIINCTNLGTIVYNNGTVAGTGGILGYANGTITVTGCKNYGTTSTTSANNNTTYNVYFSNEDARDGWGGIVGYSASMLTLSGCENRASLIWKQNDAGHNNFYAIGGIVGKMNNGSISSSKNFGNIYGGKLTGGIVGEVIGGATVSQCYNAGPVQTWGSGTYSYYNGEGTYVGGIAGASRGTIEYCYSIGTVTDSSGKGFAGGIAAATEGNINYCYSVATISSSVGTGVGNLLGHSPSVVNVGTSWAFFSGAVPSTSNTCELNGSTWTRGRAAVLPSSIATASIPSVVVPALGNTAYTSWEQITEYKFDGFGLTFTTNANSFVQAVNITTSKVAGTTPIDASFVTSSASIDGTTSTSVSNQVTLSMGFSANIDQSHAGLYIDPGKAINASINSKTYDATSGAPVLGTGNAGSQARFLYYHGGKWQTTAPTNAGTYSVAVEVISNGGVIGRQTGLSYTINKRTLTVSYEVTDDWDAYTYNAEHQGVTFVKVEGLPTSLNNTQKENVFQVTSDGTASVTLSKVHDTGTSLKYEVSGAVDVGSYSVNVTLSDTSNYTLTGLDAGSYGWTIGKKELILTVTYENGQNLSSYVYSAEHQGVNQLQISEFPTNSDNQSIVTVETLSGSTKPTVSQKTQNPLVYSISGAKEVGNYGFVVTLHDTHNYTLKYGSKTSATHNFSWAITQKPISDDDIIITWDGHTNLEYNGRDQIATATVVWKSATTNASGANCSGSDMNLALNYHYNRSVSGDTVNVTAEGITITITGKGNFTGTATLNYKIAPYNLVAHVLTTRDAFIYYGGTAFGAPSRNETYGWDMYPFVNLTDSNGYAVLDAGVTSDAQIYDIVYSAERFKLVTNLGQLNPNLITTETTLADGEVFDSINAATGVSSLTTITWEGTQNYTGTVTVKFVVVNSDFSAVSPADRNGDGKVESEWGSVDNPYVISHWIHLLRLSEIVNGNSDPINSVRGMGVNENNASANVVASDIFYSAHNADGTTKRSYFLLNSDIDIPEYVAFNPIGGVTFSSAKKDALNNDVTLSYFGGVFNGYEAGANRTYTINLRDHLNDDYTLLSENFRAGGEDVDNLFDGNTATKLCYDNGSGSATFIIEISNPRYIRGFYWATANDTFSGYTSRNPYNFQIWGSNDNSTWTQLINTSKDNWVGADLTYSENVNFTNPGAYRYVKVTVRNKSNSGLLQLSEFGVYSDYVGLFGVVKGNVINNTAAHAEVNNVVITTTSAIEGNDYVGSLIGKADSYVRVDYTYKSGDELITSQYNNTIAINGANYVGGVVGYVGLGVEMYGEFVNDASVTGTGDYVGGIIGQLKAGAGRQGTAASERNNYTFGEFEDSEGNVHKFIMTNWGAVEGINSVGGIIGGMVTNSGDYSGVQTVFNPTYVRNFGNILASNDIVNDSEAGFVGSYAGGFIGEVQPMTIVRLTNTEGTVDVNTWSYNGNLECDGTTITALDNAGGLFGVLSEGGHQITSVFSTATVSPISFDDGAGVNIGGLVGHMGGGTFKNCFVTVPGTTKVDTSTDRVRGNENVGGLVGYMYIGTLDNCYVQGFKYDNNVTVNKGGVVGAINTVTIRDTWALYLTADPTYTTIPANIYGKYILAFDGAMSATIDEMLVFAGLIPDSAVRANAYHRATGTTAGEITAQKGSISIGITTPTTTGSTINDFDTKVQVVFYDGSGYQEAYADAFEDAANDSTNNLFIRLDASSGSVIIAKTGVRFGSVTNYTEEEAWEAKYVGLSPEYQADVTNPVDNTGAGTYDGEFITQYMFSRYPHTLISSDYGNNGETMSKLFDGKTGTKFCYSGKEHSFTIDLGEDVYVDGYRWATANDTLSFPTRNPSSFIIEGSDNNSTWTTLVEDVNDKWTTENYTWVNGKAFTNPGTYRYIRVTVSSSGEPLQLSEFMVGNFVNTSREITFNFKKYSEVAPRVISTQADWNAFAAEVRNDSNGTVTVGNYYVKLATNSVVVDHTNIAGLENTPYFNGTTVTGGYFGGIFDGDGYYITVNINSANTQSVNELGAFPQARDATFQNLTIRGNITTTGSDVGAFVGIARGPLTFYNCVNQATVYSTGHNIGGILGTANNQNVVFIGCVNEGNITAGSNFVLDGDNDCLYIDYGVGGIVGSTGRGAGSTILIDSCRNAGTITGDAAVGGIVGACRAAAQVTNCGNTGNCTATKTGADAGQADCAVGGIVGAASQDGGANIYACYNSGEIVAYGNKAGGIIGTDAEYTTSSRTTNIYNCYNTGDIYTGSKTSQEHADYGVQAGGIIGASVRTNISYCYNVGKVTANGLVYHVANPHARVGGIAGYANGAGANSSTKIYYCYNAGPIIIGVKYDTSWLDGTDKNQTTYAAGIIGYISESDALSNGNVVVSKSFSLEYQVERLHYCGDQTTKYNQDTNTGTYHAYRFQGAVLYTAGCASSGNYLSSIEELTSVYDSSTGIVRPKNDEVYEAFGGSGVSTALTSSYQNGTTNASQLAQGLTSGGYVFVYGCLPQLAVFALDTENGTAMTSQNYVKDKMGIYHLEKAGSENNPYIIKDGIDLMGVNALMQTSYNFDNKYIEFANGENNLSGDICQEIVMPDETAGEGKDAADKQNYYKFKNGKTSDYSEGKSYHLFKKGAYCSIRGAGEYRAQHAFGADNTSVPAVKYTYARTNWKSANDYWNESAWVSNADLTNVNYYGRYGTAFKGTIDGHNGSGPSVISNAKIVYSASDLSIGLFGLVEDATIANIAVTGTIDAYGSGTVSAGVVGKALGNSTISGVHAGSATVTTGSSNGNLAVTSYTGADAHVGGIVGMADSGESGNRLTIADSVVANATVNSHKGAVGGIVSYVQGADISSFIDITGCHVQKATLSTADNYSIGGIIGIQGSGGALSIRDCKVGDTSKKSPATANVIIRGHHALGGIIAYATTGATLSASFEDCYVYGDVLIEKTAATNFDSSTYFTSIGGITGAVVDSTDSFVTFRGDMEFYGTINLGGFTGVKNVGGVVGYMGTSARMEQSFVEVYGTINAAGCANSENIGGFAGISKGVCLDGAFAIAPTLTTDVSSNVGGFIGLNDGDTYITRTSLIYTSKVNWADADGDDFPDQNEITITGAGSVVAKEKVGGFIGANNVGCELHMGAAEYKGAIYGEDGDLAYIELGSSVDGLRYIGGFLGYNAGEIFGEYCDVINTGAVGTASVPTEGYETIDCIGGVFGDNTATGEINISEDATFINSGQVGNEDHIAAKQEFVGGIIGVVLGPITNNGSMQNMGDVYGYQYVGGAIGGLVNGTISGELSNGNGVVIHATAESEALVASDEAVSTAATGSSSVKAVVNVGGVIGVIMQDATISGATLTNYGSVTSTGDSYNVSNLGGAIGLNYGIIENSEFYNYGEITAKNFAGGAIGVNDGTIKNSDFVNSATIHFTGDTALGGAVGYITNNYTTHGSTAYYPDNPALSAYEYNDSTRNFSTVTDSYFGYESIDNSKVVVQATGVDPYAFNANDDADSAFAAQGGLGGVFGAINSDDMTASGGWSGNTFFVYGDVYGGVFKSNASNGGVYVDDATTPFTNQNFGGTVQAVGGVIGAIEVSYISIHNMLIYKSNVGGKDYVGGIVGYNDNANEITGSGAAIDNCYNVYGEVIGTTYNGGAISASYKHVGGIVGFVPSSTDPGLINDSSNYNKPVTNASYWIKSYSNEHLQNSNPQDIVNTLDKASTWTEFLSHADYINNNDPYYQVDDEGNVVNEGKLAEGQTWDEYFAIHTQYVQNANEDWGTYQDVTINYNTGVKATGFYYIFAEAEEGNTQFEYAKEAIQVEHSNAEEPLTSPYTNDESLNFWLIIANSAGQSVKSYKSDQVAPYVNDGNVVPGYIYSTAFNSNKNGYYLYVSDESTGRAATSLYAGTTDANGNTQVYVSSDASTAGNVMIFYKEAVMLSYLNYNGYERYAPIADVTYKQDMTGGVYGTNYYSFTNDVAGDTINTGREAGSYDVQASIYTVDKVGTVITLGKLDSTLADGEDYKWNIRKRTLEVEFETGDIGDTGEDKNLWNRYDGTFSHYIKFTVTNFAKDEYISEAQVYEAINDMMALKYSFNGSSSTETIDAIYDSWNFLSGSVIPDSTGFDESVTHIAYYRTDYDGSSAKPGDKSNTIVDGTYSELGSLQIYKADYIVFVKKAGKHTVKVEVAGTEKNHSSPKKNSKDYNVDMRDLILDFTYSQGSSLLPTYDFDGGKKWQGIQSVVISGFLVGDALKDNITTVGSTASLLNGDGKADKDNIVANDNNTVTVNFFANNAGTYQAHIEISEAIRNNYRFVKQSDAGFPGSLSPSTNSYEWDASWTINKHVITLENVTITGKTVYYNGRIQTVDFGTGDDDDASFIVEHGNETVTVNCQASITEGGSATVACNVGTYTVNISSGSSGTGSGTVEGENSLATKGINNYTVNYTIADDQQATLTIKEREVRLVWDNPDLSYVYSGNAQGLSINDLTFEMKNDEGTWAEYKDAKLSVENGKIKVSNVFAYDGKSETLYFSFSDFTAEDAGSYTAKVTEFDSVSGTNDAGSAEKGNYSASMPDNKTYNIAKSKIVVAYNNNTNLDKTFDNTSTVKANLGSVSLSSQNGGATSVRVTLSNAFFCDNSGNAVVNVGNGYSIKVNMSLSDTKNYEFVGASTQVFNVGAKITPAPLTITINNSSSGANTVYKTFDNSDIYAVVESNGTNRVSSTGTQFRTGRGITVDGFFTDGVTVTATFAEIDGNRAWASKYVNNVIRTVSTPYVYTMSDEDFYKKLHIVLSSEGGESNNYYIAAVKNKSGTTILTQSSGQYIDVMDSRAEGSNTNGDNIKIAITKYSLKATYSNTAQSYANPDNSYNLDWLEVDGTLRIPSSWGLSSSDLDVDVANGWMYVNGTSGEKKQYEQYTRIAGSATSPRLGATLTSADGKHLCLTLRNQPTLIIGYFVEKKDGYEIGSMAGLLIASEYFKNNFNTSEEKGYDYVQTEIPFSKDDIISGHSSLHLKVPDSALEKINSGEIDSWEDLLAAVPEYDPRGYTHENVEYEGANYYLSLLDDLDDVTDEYLKEALQSQLDSFEFVYELINESGEAVESETLHLVWWVPEEVKDTRTYNSFILVNNIDAILTDADVSMLTGAFGSNYGVGKTYLPNVVFAEAGSVVIFNGPIFDYSTDKDDNKIGFNGVFDGDGYSIDHLTITYVVTETSHNNVGMFAEVSGNGSQVTAINLRNLSIQVVDTTASAKVINVGGVAGKFAASTVMEDVTVHGTISVKSTLGTVHAGGVIGSDSTGYVDGGVSKVIDGAIVVATVRAEGAIAVAGGVIGIMNEVNTTLTDVVSLSEVYAKGANTYANGFVGQYAKLVDANASYNQDGIDYAPLNSTGKTSAYMNSIFEISADGTYTRIAGGVSYDTLYDGSSTAYVDGIYLNAIEREYGTYDMVGEKNAIAGKNTTGSMRLRDIVDTYVLGYELSAYTSGTGDSAIATYRKSTTSKYVGTADGTADNRIGIAYQQHLNLIRMFNYMNFTLNRDVTMYTGYKLYMVDEAFTGTMTAGSYVINVRDASVKALDNGSNYPVFFANQTAPYTWLKID